MKKRPVVNVQRWCNLLRWVHIFVNLTERATICPGRHWREVGLQRARPSYVNSAQRNSEHTEGGGGGASLSAQVDISAQMGAPLSYSDYTTQKSPSITSHFYIFVHCFHCIMRNEVLVLLTQRSPVCMERKAQSYTALTSQSTTGSPQGSFSPAQTEAFNSENKSRRYFFCFNCSGRRHPCLFPYQGKKQVDQCLRTINHADIPVLWNYKHAGETFLKTRGAAALDHTRPAERVTMKSCAAA